VLGRPSHDPAQRLVEWPYSFEEHGIHAPAERGGDAPDVVILGKGDASPLAEPCVVDLVESVLLRQPVHARRLSLATVIFPGKVMTIESFMPGSRRP
jgi:hypothetical protein